MPYLSASEVVFHEEALYQVYVPLPFTFTFTFTFTLKADDKTHTVLRIYSVRCVARA